MKLVGFNGTLPNTGTCNDLLPPWSEGWSYSPHEANAELLTTFPIELMLQKERMNVGAELHLYITCHYTSSIDKLAYHLGLPISSPVHGSPWHLERTLLRESSWITF
jgi:hypothetical protein